MSTLFQLSAATRAARTAAKMSGIGTQVERGLFQVVNVTPTKKGGSIVDPLSDWISISEAIEVMRQIEADRGFRVEVAA